MSEGWTTRSTNLLDMRTWVCQSVGEDLKGVRDIDSQGSGGDVGTWGEEEMQQLQQSLLNLLTRLLLHLPPKPHGQDRK